MTSWDEKWTRLRTEDVFPFPLATETNHTSAGWRVDLIVVLEVSAGGHRASVISTYEQPYVAGADAVADMSPAEAGEVTRAALEYFADRLHQALAAS